MTQVIAGVIALLLVIAAAEAMTLLGNQLDPHNREAADEAAEEDRRRLR